MNDWMQAQQRYWGAWSEVMRSTTRGHEPPRDPLAEGIEQWWKAVSPLTPPSGREVFERLMEVSRGYFRLLDGFLTAGKEGGKGAAGMDDWLEMLRKPWAGWSTVAPGGSRPEDASGLRTFWDLPLDTWNRLAANLVPMPGDFTQAFHGGAALPQQIDRFLSVPAVGYTREAQEQFQVLLQHQTAYAAALRDYQAAFARLAMDSAMRFQKSMPERMAGDVPPSSLRELYDQWVELSEAAYSEFVMTEEYQVLYGELVNRLLALKRHLGRMVDEALEAMHMPSSAEIRSLQCRQQESRREAARLRRELGELRREVEALRQAVAPPAAAEPAAAASVVGAATKAPPRPRKAAAPKAAKAEPAKARSTRTGKSGPAKTTR